MPRGGRRPGAGRKPGRTLRLMERMRIGARCERLWREERHRAEESAIRKETLLVSEEWEKAQSVPVAERAAWLDSWEGEEYLEDVRAGLQVDQGFDLYDDSEPERIRTILPKRPKNLRRPIIEKIAAEESERRGARVTPRMVESCWKEFRRIQNDTAE